RMNREREDAGEPLFANPRNAAAGTMRNLAPALVARRGLSAFTYQLVEGLETQPVEPTTASGSGLQASGRSRWDALAGARSPEPGASLSHSEMLTAMRDWGLPVEPHWRRCDDIAAVAEF